jgi:hypothetical protein
MVLKNDIRTAWWTSKQLNVGQVYDILHVGYSTLLSDTIGGLIDEFDSELPALIKKRASCAFAFEVIGLNSVEECINGKTTYLDPEVEADEFLMARYLEYMMPKF